MWIYRFLVAGSHGGCFSGSRRWPQPLFVWTLSLWLRDMSGEQKVETKIDIIIRTLVLLQMYERTAKLDWHTAEVWAWNQAFNCRSPTAFSIVDLHRWSSCLAETRRIRYMAELCMCIRPTWCLIHKRGLNATTSYTIATYHVVSVVSRCSKI